jgi:hypothetical protein
MSAAVMSASALRSMKSIARLSAAGVASIRSRGRGGVVQVLGNDVSIAIASIRAVPPTTRGWARAAGSGRNVSMT